jgi:hypothetical protein
LLSKRWLDATGRGAIRQRGTDWAAALRKERLLDEPVSTRRAASARILDARYVAAMTLRSIAVLAAALALTPAAAEAKRFRSYVAWGVADSTFAPPPSHSCPVGVKSREVV